MTLLQGIKVADFSRVAAGPASTMVLGDLGADVIKVERPGLGDDTRHMDAVPGGQASGYYLGVNRNKRSISLDLGSESGRQVAHRLIEWADVVVHSFTPRLQERFGFSFEAVRKINDQVVYCEVTSFGTMASLQDKPAYDIIGQALTGMIDITGELGGPPAKCGPPVVDLSAGVMTALGVVAGLFARDRTGVAQEISAGLIGSGLFLMAPFVPSRALGTTFKRVGSGHNTIAPYQAFVGQDERWFIIAAAKDSFWRQVLDVVGMPELATDDRFLTNGDRTQHREELAGILQAKIGEAPAQDWIDRLEDVGVPCAMINTIDDVIGDKEFVQAGYVNHVTYEGVGDVPVVMTPLRINGEAPQVRLSPPRLDEHRSEILAMLGFDDSAAAAL